MGRVAWLCALNWACMVAQGWASTAQGLGPGSGAWGWHEAPGPDSVAQGQAGAVWGPRT